MTVNRYFMPAIAVLALVAVVFVTRLTGDWIVSGKDIPLGDMTAADIKGWMTLENVSDGLKIPMADLYRLAGIPEGSDIPPTTAMKDLEKLVDGFETSLLREAVEASLAGQPVPAPAAMEATAVPPTPAATPQPTAATVELVATPTPHTPLASGTGEGTGTGPTPLPPGQVLAADDIKGRMTLKDIAAQCAVPLDKLLEALKLPANTNTNTEAKDLVEGGKIAEIQVLRDAVKALQASK